MADSSEKPEFEKVGEETKKEATKPSTENVEGKSDTIEESTEIIEAVAAEAAEEPAPAEPAPVAKAMPEESKADQPDESVEVEPKMPGVKETHEFSALECQAESVVVYLDRAEVCRSLNANLQRGEHEIIIKNMSACIDEDSIRLGKATFVKAFVFFNSVDCITHLLSVNIHLMETI